MSVPTVLVPLPADALASALGRHVDYRVQRRIEPMKRSALARDRFRWLHGVALDVETTGLDPLRHDVIELAMQTFRLDEFGRIVETGRPRAWFEEPTEAIPPKISRITGITDAQVAGRSIADGEAASVIMSADFVVSHNAAFDRPFVEKRLPITAGRPWVCTLKDVDWGDLGFEERRLSSLLNRMGWFFEPHRAITDVAALLHLLDHPLDEVGGTVAKRAVTRAQRPSWIVEVGASPFSAKDVLKEREYAWDPDVRVWSRSVPDLQLAEEVEWATVMVYGGRRAPETRRVTWTERYAARRT
jgi:DNA polymerase III subunit epsilon